MIQRLEKVETKEKMNESKKNESPEQEVQWKAEECPGEEIISPIQDKRHLSIGILNYDYDVSDKFSPSFQKDLRGMEKFIDISYQKVPGFRNTSNLLIKLHFLRLKLLEGLW